MNAIQIISQDLFDKVRSRFSNLEMGDETGAVTIDPASARFFDFDFVIEGNDLGRVSISLNEPGSLKVYYSQGITENQDDPVKQYWYSFLKEMRFFSMRRLLRFDTRDIAKTNLDKHDFQYLANKGTEEPEMQMNESKWTQKSSKKTSRAVKGATEVIVRHAHAVDETYPGARSQRKNIKAIFIQNRDGERFKYPFIHPAGAFAMAQHVDHGGVPHDPAGKAIIRMSEQIAQLQEFQRKVQRTSLHDDAMGITERAVGRLQELKGMIEALGKRHHYESWMSEFNEQEIVGDTLAELDAVTMEEYKTKFTETNFKEELAQFFPLIHSIMREANKVDLEDYVSEGEACQVCHEDPCQCDDESANEEILGALGGGALGAAFGGPLGALTGAAAGDSLTDPDADEVDEKVSFDNFEEWADAVEQGKLTNDQISQLKQALADLETPLDLDTAFNFFNQFGIDDSDLENKFKQTAELDSTTDPMQVFKLWAQESYPELLVALGMSGTQPSQEPVAEAPEDRTSYQVAKVLANKGIAYDSSKEDELINAIGMILVKDLNMSPKQARHLISYDEDFLGDTFGELQHMLQGKEENTEMSPPPGAMESRDPKEMIHEVAKIVKSFYNRDNPEVGPFRGEEGILIDVEKTISEKFGEQAGQQARMVAEKYMEKLTNEWQQKHGTPGDDGLARIQELIGNIKGRVEEMGGEKNPQHSHQYDTTMKHADNPTYQQRMAAHDIKPGIKGYRDRVDLLKDLERTGKLKSEDIQAFEDIMKLAGLAK